MRGMILAAGRGQRMRELTLNTPKPLLRVNNQYLIEYSIWALAKAGVQDIVINISYHAQQIIDALGHGARYGVRLQYSYEEEALETGGGIFQALPLLGEEPFIVLSSDVMMSYPLQQLSLASNYLAHLILVDNPSYHPEGDFALVNGEIDLHRAPKLTFGNIGIYRPELFAGCQAGRFRLGDLLKRESENKKISGEYFSGDWYNIGTPEDLDAAKIVF